MKRLAVILILILFLLPLTAAAQSDCGDGLPCGPLPWRVPQMPRLASPTPIPPANSLPNVGAPTPTPVPSGQYGGVNAVPVADQLSTIEAVMGSTPVPVLDAQGTPVTVGSIGLGGAGQVFGYARALSYESFGPLWPLVNFALMSIGIVILVKSITFLLPLIAALFGIVRKIITLILDFLPL